MGDSTRLMIEALRVNDLDRFSLVKHPKLMQICREKGIMVEVCPIS
jgi:adenosine deaminase